MELRWSATSYFAGLLRFEPIGDPAVFAPGERARCGTGLIRAMGSYLISKLELGVGDRGLWRGVAEQMAECPGINAGLEQRRRRAAPQGA